MDSSRHNSGLPCVRTVSQSTIATISWAAASIRADDLPGKEARPLCERQCESNNAINTREEVIDSEPPPKYDSSVVVVAIKQEGVVWFE